MSGCSPDPLQAPRTAPDLFEQARQRRQVTAALWDELMASPPERWRRKLRTARFHSPEIVRLLLEESRSRQLIEPTTARELAALADRLAGQLTGPAAGAMTRARARAFCLEVNALRLCGERAKAVARLRRTPEFHLPEEQPAQCRTSALVWWEEGLGVVALEKLQQAALLYGSVGLTEEAGTCQGLLGLVHLDEGELAQALPPLWRGWRAISRRRRPLTALRVALGLALALAEDGQEGPARTVLFEAWQLYRQVLDDPEELLRVQWREALVLSRLGQRAEASAILETVFRSLCRPGTRAEAVLAALDLALVLAEHGRRAEIADVFQQLEDLFPEPQGLPPEVGTALELLRCGAAGRDFVADRSVSLRRSFRIFRHRIQPFPFV